MTVSADANGHAPRDATKDAIRAERRKAALLEAQLRVKIRENQLKTATKIRESAEQWDFIGTSEIFDRINSFNNATGLGATFSTARDRRYGENWPFWRTWSQHARIRFGSRLIVGSSGLASGILEGLTSSVIGEGYTYQVIARKNTDPPKELLAACQAADDAFIDLNHWSELEQEIFQRERRDGEYILRDLDQGDGSTIVHTIEPEWIVEPPDGDREINSFGFYNDRDDLLTITGAWVTPDGDSSHGEFVPASELDHSKCNVDRIIKRGLPDFSFDTYDTFKRVNRLLANLTEGGAIQAAIAFIRQHETATPAQVGDFLSAQSNYQFNNPATGNLENTQRFDAGTILDIDKGQTFVEPPFARATQSFVEIVQAALRSVAVRWNAPEWLVSSDASNGNYSSSLVAESPFVKRVKRVQKKHVGHFKKIHWRVLRNAANAGRIRVQGHVFSFEEIQRLVDIEVTPPTVEVRNALEEAQTNQVKIQGGWYSRQQACREDGGDWEQVQQENEEYDERHGQQGQPLQGPGPDDGGGGGGPAPGGLPGGGAPRPGDGGDDGDPFGGLDVGSGSGADFAKGPALGESVLETKDASGHEHAKDGKFGSGGTKKSDNQGQDLVAVEDEYKKHGTKAKAFKDWFGDWEGDPKNASKVANHDGSPKETFGTGEPVKVYHGTTSDFDEFNLSKAGANAAHVGPGFYFAEDQEVAKTFTGADRKGKIIESYLNIRKPLDFDSVPANAEIEKWVSATASIDARIKPSALKKELANRADYEERPLTAFEVWKVVSAYAGRDGANKVVQSIGYDGITHQAMDSGGTVKLPDVKKASYGRVWIAFKPTQIKAVDNAGTFDPKSAKLREQLDMAILEAGYTGTITDKGGRKRKYVDGKPVAMGGAAATTGAQAKKKAKAVAAGGGHAPEVQKAGRMAAVKAAYAGIKSAGIKVKSAAGRVGKAVWDKMPKPAQKTAATAYHVGHFVLHKAEAGIRAGKAFALEVARQRGLPEAHVESVGRVLGIADNIAAWTVNMPATLAATGSVKLAKAASFLPLASMAYVAYSAARNPFAVARAAKAALTGKLLRAKAHEGVDITEDNADLAATLLERFEAAGEQGDWYSALLSAALDETHDLGKAIELADAAFKEQGEGRGEDVEEETDLGEDDSIPILSEPQQQSYSCGPAAIREVLARLGVDKSEEELIAFLGTDPENGTPPDAMVAGCKKLGLDVEAKSGMTVAELEQCLDAGQPVIVCLQAWGTPDGYAAEESGHWAVAIGANKGNILFADSELAGPLERGFIPHEEFDRRWRDKDGDGREWDHFGIVVSGVGTEMVRESTAPTTEAKSGGKWITIGGKGESGDRHGGSRVYVEGGRITKGAPSLTGKKIDALKDEAEPVSHRKALNQSKGHARATWGKKAKAQGVSASDLHQFTAEILAHDKAFKDEHNQGLGEARKLSKHYGVNISNLSRAFKNGDQDQLKHFDEVASIIGPRMFPSADESEWSEKLFDALRSGNVEPMSEDDAYEQALDHLSRHKENSKGSGGDVPF